MSFFKVGCNFSKDLYEQASHLNKEVSINRIEEFYGSRKESAWLTARPEFRLQNVTRDEFARYINELSERGISFNYTLNTSYLGNKEQIIKREEEIQEYISFLIEAGVKTITVSLPYMAEIIRRVSDKIGIEVSTIAHLDSLTQIKIWQELYGITKICIGLNKNRDINFLSAAARYCNEHDIVLTLLANEFCGNGITESDEIKGATGCIFRDHCYQLHSAGYQKETKLHKDYPMGMCIASRKSKSVWLKMNYIRPEDVKRYNEIGIDHFKLTGRTGSTAHLQEIMRAYMKESYDGNLLGLWKHLETIKEEKEESFRPQVYIDNKIFLSDLLYCCPCFFACRMIIVLILVRGPPYCVLRVLIHNDELILRRTSGVDTSSDINSTQLGNLSLLIAFQFRLCLLCKQIFIRRIVYNFCSSSNTILA